MFFKFVSVCLVVAATHTKDVKIEGRQLNETKIKGLTLNEAYGEVPEVKVVNPWHLRTKIARSDEYLALRNPARCRFPFEIYIVQDCTDSFQPHFAPMWQEELPQMVADMSKEHPGSSYGLLSFRDKPIWSLGDPQTDYCVEFETPLSKDPQVIYNRYSELFATGGGDPAENSFGALWAASRSDTPGWSDPNAARLLVLVTDAPPHFEGDGFNAYGIPSLTHDFDEAHKEEQCLNEYYPGPDTVADAIRIRQAYLAVLVHDGNSLGSLPSDSWKWFNRYLGQTDEFVGILGEKSKEFWESLSKIIDEIEEIECDYDETTSTVSPTTAEQATSQEATSQEATSVEATEPCEPCEPCTGDCPCPEVVIRFAHRPKDMKLWVNGTSL